MVCKGIFIFPMATSTDGKRATHPAFIQLSALIRPFIGISKNALAHVKYSIITTKCQNFRSFAQSMSSPPHFLGISGEKWPVFAPLLVYLMNYSKNAFINIKYKTFKMNCQKNQIIRTLNGVTRRF